MRRTSDNSYKSYYVSNCAISAKIDSQIAYTMLDFGYPLRMGDGMVYCKERHPLLMKWVITFLRCITKMEGDSERASTDPCCPHHAISIKVDSQIAHKL